MTILRKAVAVLTELHKWESLFVEDDASNNVVWTIRFVRDYIYQNDVWKQ